MKRSVYLIIPYVFCALFFAGCGPSEAEITTMTASPQEPTISPVETKPVTVSPTIAPAEPVSTLPGILGVVVFDVDHKTNGLAMDYGGDVDTEQVFEAIFQEWAFRTGNGQALPSTDGNTVGDWYIQFQVDDDFIYEGSPTSRVQIEIEYLDEGNDSFNIQYDAVSGGVDGSGLFKESDLIITKTGTGDFKTAVFILDDAYFANRNNGADFRISSRFDGAETIRRVTVTLLDV